MQPQTNTIQGFKDLFDSGDIALISAIIYDNPDQVNENLRSVGLPVGANETDIFNILKAEGPNLTEDQFCQILNVPFIGGPYTQSLRPVLYSQANVYNPGTNQVESIRWGVFKAGMKKAFVKYFKNKAENPNPINIPPVEMPKGEAPDMSDADRKIIRKMRVKTAITWGVLALILVLVVVKIFKKK